MNKCQFNLSTVPNGELYCNKPAKNFITKFGNEKKGFWVCDECCGLFWDRAQKEHKIMEIERDGKIVFTDYSFMVGSTEYTTEEEEQC